ncbi:hypothetical protein TKK_0017657 [Trichogramma kaykai]
MGAKLNFERGPVETTLLEDIEISEILNETVTDAQGEERVEDWVRYGSGYEALSQLEMKTNGSALQKKVKLFQWLSGDYFVDNFAEINLNEIERKEHHMNVRSAYINTTCWEKSGETIIVYDVDNDRPHPLIKLNSSKQVRANLEKLMGQATVNHSQRPENSTRLGEKNCQPGSKNRMNAQETPERKSAESLMIISMLSQIE